MDKKRRAPRGRRVCIAIGLCTAALFTLTFTATAQEMGSLAEESAVIGSEQLAGSGSGLLSAEVQYTEDDGLQTEMAEDGDGEQAEEGAPETAPPAPAMERPGEKIAGGVANTVDGRVDGTPAETVFSDELATIVPAGDTIAFLAAWAAGGSILLEGDIELVAPLGAPGGGAVYIASSDGGRATITQTGNAPLVQISGPQRGFRLVIEGDGTVTLDGNIFVNREEALGLNEVMLKGFTIQNSGGFIPREISQSAGNNGAMMTMQFLGDLTIEDCEFINTGAGGPVNLFNLYNTNGQLQYRYTTIKNCSLTQGEGVTTVPRYGFLVADANIDLTGCTFLDMETSYGAFALYSGKLQVDDCRFENVAGVALYIDEGVQADISNTVFRSSGGGASETYTAGAIEASGASHISIDTCLFEGNMAGESSGEGGAIRAIRSPLSVTNTIFTGNSASSGGAIAFRGAGNARLVVSGCTFTDNAALTTSVSSLPDYIRGGGAIYIEDRERLYINGSTTFAGNHAAGGGWIMTDVDDIAQHGRNIGATQFTAPFQYAYNNHDVVYVAGTRAADTVDVAYHGEGDSALFTLRFGEGHLVKSPAAAGIATPEGKVFTGWAIVANGEVVYREDQAVIPLTDLELYAIWRDADAALYTALFDAAGGNYTPPAQVLPAGGPLKEPDPAPIMEGYHFTGWYTPGGERWLFAPAGETPADTMPEGGITLTARYEAAAYTVSFLYNDSVNTKHYRQVAALYGERIEELAAPSLDGKSFTGWYQTDGTLWSFENTMPSHDLVLVAGWRDDVTQPPETTSSSITTSAGESSSGAGTSSQPVATTRPSSSYASSSDGQETSRGGGEGGGASSTVTSVTTSRRPASSSVPAPASSAVSSSTGGNVSSSGVPAVSVPEEINTGGNEAQPEASEQATAGWNGGQGVAGDADYIEPSGTVRMFGSDVPLGGLASVGGFSIINLLLAIAALASGVAVAARGRVRSVRPVMHWAAVLSGILPIAMLPWLETLGQPILFSRWTPLFIAVALAHAGLVVLARIVRASRVKSTVGEPGGDGQSEE